MTARAEPAAAVRSVDAGRPERLDARPGRPAPAIPQGLGIVPATGILVGRADDPAEMEAEKAANRVMSVLRRSAGPKAGGAPMSGAERSGGGAEPVVGASGGMAPAATAAALRSARGGGSPIPPELRRSMEGAFGADFSAVRVHDDRNAAALSRSLQAQAFTHGSDVFLSERAPELSTDAGRHLLAHELAHVAQGGGAPIRRAMNVDEVLDTVEASDFLKGKLAGGTDAQTRNAGSTETMRDRVRKVLAEHQSLFAADDAMSLAIAVDGVAKVIASELYDNSLKPAIAAHLMKHYRSTLSKGLSKGLSKKQRTAVMKKATALVSTDALALYMHHERGLTDAAWDIKDAAEAAGVQPDAMFAMLSEKFQAEMASYSFADISGQQDTAGSFNRSEATGEMSTNYLKELFGDSIGTAPNDRMPKNDAGAGLKFDAAAAKRLGDLGSAVDDTMANDAVDPRPKTAAQRRKRFLDQVQDADAAVMKDRTKLVVTELQTWGLTKIQAKMVVDQLKAGLPKLPLTITHWAQPRTAKGRNFDTKDVSRSGQKNKATVKGGKFETLGKYVPAPGGADRGEHYMQFRGWKDRMMTGNQGMDGAEMPVFGAVNPLFDKYKGTDATPVPTRSKEHRELSAKNNRSTEEEKQLAKLNKGYAPIKDEVDRRQALPDDHKVGMNYYGDMHLVLRRKRVADRLIYTAGDHGRPHRDPFLVFADFLLGSQGTYRADLTRLKGPADGPTPDGMKNTAYAKALVAVVLGTDSIVQTSLPFEVQIHGGVDWETDVKEIWISPGAPTEAKDRMQAWATAKPGRPAVRVVQPPPLGTVIAKNIAEFSAEGPAEAKKL